MARYLVGPSPLTLTGAQLAQPGETVEHDFSINGPDGAHGPGREAALIAAGALTLVTEAVRGDQPSGRRRHGHTDEQEA